jgi:SAM-dependent methyltransferase
MDAELRLALRRAYARQAGARDRRSIQPWKIAERQNFLERLQAAGAHSLLEIGAGTGQDAEFFAAHGLQVLATDLTPENVAACRQKGLEARVMDVCALDLPDAQFDAAFSLNCLLHLPKSEFPKALSEISRVLKPGGLFYLGLYGGQDSEGIYEDDTYEPKRFFSFWSDEGLKNHLEEFFEVISFNVIPLEEDPELIFQSVSLKKI